MQAHCCQNDAEYEVVEDDSHEDPLDLNAIVKGKAQVMVFPGASDSFLVQLEVIAE